MHPVSDYIPAFVFMAASLAIPREGDRNDDAKDGLPEADPVVVESAVVPEVSEISKYVEGLYRFEHFENPMVAPSANDGFKSPTGEPAWKVSAVDPRLAVLKTKR